MKFDIKRLGYFLTCFFHPHSTCTSNLKARPPKNDNNGPFFKIVYLILCTVSLN